MGKSFKVALVYGSFHQGNSERDIKHIRSSFPGCDLLNVTEPTAGNDFKFNTLRKYNFLIVCTSSRYGMPPANFVQFAQQLFLASKDPSKPLKHLQHAVFGNGWKPASFSKVYGGLAKNAGMKVDPNDPAYTCYMNNPRYMDLLLERAGSRRFFARGECGGPFADLDTDAVSCDQWAPAMWKACADAMWRAGDPPVAWDACWAKEKSTKHHLVTEWDFFATVGQSDRDEQQRLVNGLIREQGLVNGLQTLIQTALLGAEQPEGRASDPREKQPARDSSAPRAKL